MERDWDIIKKVLEEVVALEPGDSKWFQFDDTVVEANAELHRALDIIIEERAEEDIESIRVENLQFMHARMLLPEGVFIPSFNNGWGPGPDAIIVKGLTMRGYEMLDTLKQPSVLKAMKAWGSKVSPAMSIELGKVAVEWLTTRF